MLCEKTIAYDREANRYFSVSEYRNLFFFTSLFLLSSVSFKGHPNENERTNIYTNDNENVGT